ncbi:MAG: hypothetical protein K2Q18_19550 [Bdellovibrionales bacterium]|nr:hypothetical protein [Bdellovibrionales bacterium]
MFNVQKITSLTLVLLLLTSRSALGAADYYNNIFLGEKKTQNYSGPLDPRSVYSDYSGQLILLDDLYSDHFFSGNIQNETFELHQYWYTEVMEKSACTNEVLAENLDYIRYLYRLVSISYLFEGLKLNTELSKQLGAKNSCSIIFKDVFNGCSPSSPDMKKFLERVYGKFVNEIEKNKTEAFSKKEKMSWMSTFQSSTSLTNNPVFARLHDKCKSNKENCRTLKDDEIVESLNSFCKSDIKNIQQLCAEKDSFYGLSNVQTATELIKSSNAFSLINQSGMGEECLRRYGKLFHEKELTDITIGKQFPLLYGYLGGIKGRYIQGELFLPGALKEFDAKGLSDFLNALKPPVEKPVIVLVKPRPKPKPIPEPPKPVVVEKKVVLAPAPVVPPEPPKVQISEFERGVLELKEKASPSVSIDMDLFRDSFEFTPSMITSLAGPIKKFQTRAALSDMKSYDLLGSKDAPVGLIFLKFLIDTENHQGLYNIITVIGEKFYVSNDLENKTDPHYIELRNDASTKNRWQITLIKK